MAKPPEKSDTENPGIAAKIERFRQRCAAREAEIKNEILLWLEPRDHPGDYVSVTRALFDIALDRHVKVHEADGFDLIEAAYRRALKRSRGPIH